MARNNVIIKPNSVPLRSEDINIEWLQVNETPLLSRMKVFRRGIDVAEIWDIKTGGQTPPEKISAHMLKEIYLAKKVKKNITSLPINQIIETFREISISKDLKPTHKASQEISPTHRANSRKKINNCEITTLIVRLASIHINLPQNMLKIMHLKSTGQGEDCGILKIVGLFSIIMGR